MISVNKEPASKCDRVIILTQGLLMPEACLIQGQSKEKRVNIIVPNKNDLTLEGVLKCH